MFLSSMERIVPHEQSCHRATFNPNTIKEQADIIVIPAANWLAESRDLGDLANRIEMSGLPCVVFGLGAQSLEAKKLKLRPGTERFLKVISERSHSISVRGDFTAEVIASCGIDNITVTGCPSLLWHLDRSAEIVRRETHRDPVKTILSITPPGKLNPNINNFRTQLSRKLCQFGFENNFPIVLQTEIELMKAAKGEVSLDDKETRKVLDFFWGGLSSTDVDRYVTNNLRLFGNPTDWMVFSSNHDLVLGTRLHGVIASLLSGTPAVLIGHDTRTLEMSRQAGIPMIKAEDIIKNDISPQNILEEADFDHFNKRQKSYFNDFIDFFETNKVPHKLKRIQ